MNEMVTVPKASLALLHIVLGFLGDEQEERQAPALEREMTGWCAGWVRWLEAEMNEELDAINEEAMAV